MSNICIKCGKSEEQITGTTESAKDDGVEHTHKFALEASIDDSGELKFSGQTGEQSDGDDHSHSISAFASDPSQTEYQIETESGSDGDSHVHKLTINLPKPIGEPTPDTQASDRREGNMDFADGKLRVFKEVDTDRNYPQSNVAYLSEITNAKGNTLVHEVIRTGKFVHPWFGVIDITVEKLAQMVSNFESDVGGYQPSLNISHSPDLGALGWHNKLTLKDGKKIVTDPGGGTVKMNVVGLWSDTELTPFGQREIVAMKKFRYTSAETIWDYKGHEVFPGSDDEDDVSAEESLVKSPGFGAALLGSAATNVPFIPKLEMYSAVTPFVEDLYYKLLEKYGSPHAAYLAIENELTRRGALL